MFKNMALTTGSKAEPQYEPVMVVSNMFVQRMYCEKGDALLSSEWKTVALLASLVERGDFDFHAVSMPVSRWTRLLGLPIQGGRDISRYLEHTEALEQKYCEICRVPDECSRHRWIYQQVYGQAELLSLQLNPDFLPFFATYIQPYTAIQLSMLMRLSGKYSCDLYIILKSALALGYWEMCVPTLLRRLGSPHMRSSYLVSHILQPCLEEISCKTDLAVSFEIKRDARGAAESVRFRIRRNRGLPRGKRLDKKSGPIIVPDLCEDEKAQKLLAGIYLSYRAKEAKRRKEYRASSLQAVGDYCLDENVALL